jgi:hypothetical protein
VKRLARAAVVLFALWAALALWFDGPAARPLAAAASIAVVASTLAALARVVDLFVSHWGPTLIAHTIVSWDFADARPLAVSIETRKEKKESYSAVRGFFQQYELVYVAADERDVIRLRTSFRGETVWAKACADRDDFSPCIREGLPRPPGRR